MDYIEDAIQQTIDASPSRFSNKKDAVEYYQQQYGKDTKRGNSIVWKSNLVNDILGSRDIRADIIGKEDYNKQKKNLGKRFEKRLDNPETKLNKEYQDFGKSMGLLKAPKGGYHVHYEGGVQFSTCEQREFDVDITGRLADLVAQNPERVVNIAMMLYMAEGGDESSVGPCDEDGEPEVIVTANPDDFKPTPRKQRKSSTPFFKR